MLILSVWHSSRSVQVLNASGTQQVQPEQNESAGVQHVPGPKVRQPRRRTAHVDEGSCPEPIIQTHVQIEWADQQRVVLSRQLLLFTLSHHYDIRNQVRRTGWGCTASHPIVVMRWWVLVCVCACVHLYIHSYKSIYTPNPPYIYIYVCIYTHTSSVYTRTRYRLWFPNKHITFINELLYAHMKCTPFWQSGAALPLNKID